MPYVYRQYIYIILNMQRQKKLNSDDQVFHHYQPSEQFQKGQRHIPMEIQVLDRDRHSHSPAMEVRDQPKLKRVHTTSIPSITRV